MKLLLAIFLGSLGMPCGCMQPDRFSVSVLQGDYGLVQGGFNEFISLRLSQDHSYTLEHVFLGCVVNEKGDFDSWGGTDRGTWEVQNAVLILKPTSIGTEQSPMFLPVHCRAWHILKDGKLVAVDRAKIPASGPTEIIISKGAECLPTYSKATP